MFRIVSLFFISVFLFVTSSQLFSQENGEFVPMGYPGCVFTWDYDDPDNEIRAFAVHINGKWIKGVPGTERSVTCEELGVQPGFNVFGIQARAFDGRQSVMVRYEFDYSDELPEPAPDPELPVDPITFLAPPVNVALVNFLP